MMFHSLPTCPQRCTKAGSHSLTCVLPPLPSQGASLSIPVLPSSQAGSSSPISASSMPAVVDVSGANTTGASLRSSGTLALDDNGSAGTSAATASTAISGSSSTAGGAGDVPEDAAMPSQTMGEQPPAALDSGVASGSAEEMEVDAQRGEKRKGSPTKDTTAVMPNTEANRTGSVAAAQASASSGATTATSSDEEGVAGRDGKKRRIVPDDESPPAQAVTALGSPFAPAIDNLGREFTLGTKAASATPSDQQKRDGQGSVASPNRELEGGGAAPARSSSAMPEVATPLGTANTGVDVEPAGQGPPVRLGVRGSTLTSHAL